MPLFTKRPVTIAARQLGRGPDYTTSLAAVLEWVKQWNGEATIVNDQLVITTLEGDMAAWPGDWVVKGVYNEFYPVAPDIFEISYAPATQQEIAAYQERM